MLFSIFWQMYVQNRVLMNRMSISWCDRWCEGYVRDLWGICEGSKSSLTCLNPFVQRHSRLLCEGWGIFASSIHVGSEQYSRLQWEYCSLTRSWLPIVANLTIHRSRPRRFPILSPYHSTKASSQKTECFCSRKRAFTGLYGIFILSLSFFHFSSSDAVFAP